VEELNLLHCYGFIIAGLDATLAAQAFILIYRFRSTFNQLVHIHRTDVYTFATAGAFVFVHSYLPHLPLPPSGPNPPKLSETKTGTPSQELRLLIFNKKSKYASLKLLYLFNSDGISLADLHAAFTAQTFIGIYRVGLTINHLEYIHRANIHTFLVARALLLIHSYFPHLPVSSYCDK
jgi:hypothetical protein